MKAVPPKPQAAASPAPQPLPPQPQPSCWDLGNCPVVQPPVQQPVIIPPNGNPAVNPESQQLVTPVFQPPPVTCSGGCGQKEEPQPQPVCGQGGPCPEIEPIAGSCKIRPVKGDPILNKPKLDILFVLDTSPSFRLGPNNTREGGELLKLASEMSSFVRSLPEDTDYRIGVILGNGPESPTFGKLFKGTNDPAVLDSQKMSEKEIWKALREKMLAVPDDRAPGSRVLSDPQGEMLMLNLYTILADNDRKQAVIKQGLLRKNANLAIIAVSDENDPCYSYPVDVTQYRAVDEALFDAGKVPVLKPYGKSLEIDRKEVATQRFCKTLEGTKLGHNDVLGQLRILESERKTNIIMNGIVYTSNKGLRAKVSNQDENEMGHGTLDLIRAIGSGKAMNMADVRRGNGEVSFAETLTKLGATTSVAMNFNTNWDCFGNIHFNAIDYSTVEVEILEASAEEVQNWTEDRTLDDRGQLIARYSAQCRSGKPCQAGDGGILVQGKSHSMGGFIRVKPIDELAFDKLMRERKIRAAKYKITFRTLRGIDPRTGRPGTIAN